MSTLMWRYGVVSSLISDMMVFDVEHILEQTVYLHQIKRLLNKLTLAHISVM